MASVDTMCYMLKHKMEDHFKDTSFSLLEGVVCGLLLSKSGAGSTPSHKFLKLSDGALYDPERHCKNK